MKEKENRSWCRFVITRLAHHIWGAQHSSDLDLKLAIPMGPLLVETRWEQRSQISLTADGRIAGGAMVEWSVDGRVNGRVNG